MERLLSNSIVSHLHRLFCKPLIHHHHHFLLHQNPKTNLINLKPFVAQFSLQNQNNMMKSVLSNVAVIGCGISGAVCASALARYGVSVTVFDSGRGPGGRMSQRREMTEDGKELSFDHGAPFFTITDNGAIDLVREWEERGLIAEWKENFGSFDCATAQFVDIEKEGSTKKYVGSPGMNSICKALCHESGVDAKFGVTVGNIQWLEDKSLWLLSGLDGQALGYFDGLVASDKSIVSSRSTAARPPPLDMSLCPELVLKLPEVPVVPCFALMMAFPEQLTSIPVRGFSFKNSEVLSWAFCDSSKPGRSSTSNSECWVLHSTGEYAKSIISQTGLQKPTSSLLSKVAEELFKEFQSTGTNIPKPFFTKAHRWGGAFPATAVAGEDKCLWDSSKRLAICGDFCVSPNVEGAVLSGMAAAAKFTDAVSSL